MEDQKDKWQLRWQLKHTGWDLGGPHSHLGRLLEMAELLGPLKPSSRIYSAGCGHAHNEAWLAQKGYIVDAYDFVPEAIAQAKALYFEMPRLSLGLGNVFDTSDKAQVYDAIFDRAMLCALEPGQRKAYVEAISQRLRPGGLFMAIFFRSVAVAAGPPFALTESAAFDLLHTDFELCGIESCFQSSKPQSIVAEWLGVWQCKSRPSNRLTTSQDLL